MGIRVNVYRSAMRDCTNGGLSSKYDTLTVVNADGPFEPDASAPAVLLVNHVYDCVCLRPAVMKGGKTYEKQTEEGVIVVQEQTWQSANSMFMAGGNFGHTSDGRFEALIRKLTGKGHYGAVAIHDRLE